MSDAKTKTNRAQSPTKAEIRSIKEKLSPEERKHLYVLNPEWVEQNADVESDCGGGLLTAIGILNTAADLVGGDRADKHGAMKKVHQDAARMIGGYLEMPITAEQVAMMIMLVKVARTKNGEHNEDDYVDMAGYAAIAGQIHE